MVALLFTLAVTGVLSFAIGALLSSRSSLARLWLHSSVAFAILPTAVVFCGLYLEGSRIATDFLHRISGPLSPTTANPLWFILQGTHGVDGSITTMDVQAMALLLLVAYGSVVLWRHALDIVRLFKITRRRSLRLKN